MTKPERKKLKDALNKNLDSAERWITIALSYMDLMDISSVYTPNQILANLREASESISNKTALYLSEIERVINELSNELSQENL